MENPPSKNGKKKDDPNPLPREPNVVDPQIAAWCTASKPNPGAELQSRLELKSLPSKRLRVLNCRRALRSTGVAVRGRPTPALVNVLVPGNTCAGPTCGGPTRGACNTSLGPTAAG